MENGDRVGVSPGCSPNWTESSGSRAGPQQDGTHSSSESVETRSVGSRRSALIEVWTGHRR